MDPTSMLVRDEFQTWLRDRLLKAAERRRQERPPRSRGLAFVRTGIATGLAVLAMAVSSIL